MSKITTLAYATYGTGQVRPFNQVFSRGVPILDTGVKGIRGADAIIIWGGADISPSIYGEPVSRYTGAGKGLSARDEYEVAACKTAIELGIPIIGICRGAQLACALAGGKLVQHVNNHAGSDHEITTKDGRTYVTSSVHHQMLYPWDVEHEMIAWSSEKRSDVYVGGDNEDMEHLHMGYVEPEVVYFPKIKALAIQGHPEFMAEDDDFVQYCMELTRKYVLTEEVVSV